MTQPKAGVTHDVVIHVNNSLAVGMVFAPQTLRVSPAPTMVPRIAMGDPRGLDFGLWRSFVQNDFSGGAGQYRSDKDVSDNRFAESHMIDLGLRPVQAQELIGPRRFPGESEVTGAAVIAVVPEGTSANTPVASLMTTKWRSFVFAYSDRPHLLHFQSALVYTNVDLNSDAWGVDNPLRALPGNTRRAAPYAGARQAPRSSGYWVVNNTQLPSPIYGAVPFSNCLFVAQGSNGLRIFGSTNGTSPAAWYTPSYNTVADNILVFDSRLWRTERHRLASFDPSIGTWSTFFDIGDPSSDIHSAAAVGGKHYFGKEDGLWAFEAGRVYEVQSFKDEADPHNFALMVAHRNELYFNIQQTIYRLSSYGTIERLPMPFFDGIVLDGTSTPNGVYILLRTADGIPRVWIYNPETGGIRQWFRANAFTHPLRPGGELGPAAIVAAAGQIWMLPYSVTFYNSTLTPISVVNALVPPESQAELIRPRVSELANLITPLYTFGYPGLDKIYNRLNVRYNLYNSGELIRVYYSGQFTPPRCVLLTDQIDDITSVVNDGVLDFNPADGVLAHGSGSSHIYLGFNEKVESVQVFAYAINNPGFNLTTPTQANAVLEYSNASGGWSTIRNLQIRPDKKKKGSFTSPPFTLTSTPAPDLLPPEVAGIEWTFTAPGWTKASVDGTTAYFIRLRSIGGAGTHFSVIFSEVIGRSSLTSKLEDREWQLLGDITDLTTQESSLAFPSDFVSKALALKFILHGGGASRPELLGYEVEWMPVGPDAGKLKYDGVVLGINNLELMNGTVENSANLIMATAFSLNGSRLPYIAQVPFPLPVGHTRRVVLSLAPAGVMPVLTYNTLGGVATFEGEIPITLQEV